MQAYDQTTELLWQLPHLWVSNVSVKHVHIFKNITLLTGFIHKRLSVMK